MALLSGFNVTLPEVNTLAQAALAAFSGGPVPAGWSVVTPQQIGVPPQYWDGPYFTNNGASAIVLQQGNTWIVSFRGTDGLDDVARYPELVLGNYIDNFRPLLNAVALNSPAETNFYFTGASLGGGATNLMADIASSQYGGEFASAKFVAFASPNISNEHGILNIGFENDPIYKAIDGYGDFLSSLDNFVLATTEYMAGNYDGQRPLDDYAHSASGSVNAFTQLTQSAFLEQMSPDAVVIFDASSGLVQDITPGRENIGAFYLGEQVADLISGRNGGDHVEGFAGIDTIAGGFGADTLYGNQNADLIYGNQDNDTLHGGQDNDTIYGGKGDDAIYGGRGDDTLAGNLGADRFIFQASSGSDAIIDYDFSQGDRLDLQGQAYVTRDTTEGVVLDLSGGGIVLLAGLHGSAFSSTFIV